MNRRNFLIGVGTAATLSGAASVTGAALSNTVRVALGGGSDGGGFDIKVTQELEVRRNGTLTEENVLSTDENFSADPINWSKVGQDSPVNYNDFPRLYVNSSTDADLTIELATGDDTDSPYNTNLSQGGTEPYNSSQSYGYAPIVIENTGGDAKDVGMQYQYGADVTDTNTNLSKDQVAELYQFDIDGTQVSPKKGSPDTEGNLVTFSPGQERRVDLNVNLTETTAEDIRSAAGSLSPYSFDSDGRASADLLDTAVLGIP